MSVEEARRLVEEHRSIDEAWRYFLESNPGTSRSQFRDIVRGVVQGDELQRLFFIPDTHRPFHSPEAVAICNNAIRHFKPDHLVILGDYVDNYSTSRHTKSVNRSHDLKTEVDSANEGLDEIDAIVGKDVRKYYLAGNHEYNLTRYLEEKAPELFNLIAIEELFRLEQRGWAYTPYKEHIQIGKLFATHDCGYAGQDAHIRSAAKFGSNLILGHTHRLAVSYSSTVLGDAHVALMAGWLGDPEKASYMYRVGRKDWQWGFATGFMEADGTVHIQPNPIVNGRALVNGAVIRA